MERFRACLAVILLTALLIVPVNAQWDEALVAYTAGDYETALKFLNPLADQGNASAQYNLGNMYADGRGILQDYKMAVKWFQMAADQGNASAQYNLGVMYANGQGVLQDYNIAHMFYNIAASNGIDQSRENRDQISVKMTPQQISEAQQMAREWIEKHKF